MDVTMILGTVWSVINSPAGITVMASVVIYVLNKLYTAKPALAAYEGTLIAAVKFAEKAIPDDSANKAVARLDEALKYALKIYEAKEGRKATSVEVAQITESLQVVHANLEGSGQL